MPLTSTFSLQWYGPAAGAMTQTSAASGALTLSGVASAAMSASGAVTGFMKATRLRNSPLYGTAAASGVVGPMRARARMSMHGKVNELTQDDVAGAVLDAPIDGAITLRQLLRLIGAASAGKVSGAAGTTVTIRDLNDTKDRIVATVDANGNRTAVTRDLT